jgi:hypothetical protein
MEQYKGWILLLCILTNVVWSRFSEVAEDSEIEEGLSGLNKRTPANYLDLCLDEKTFLSLYSKPTNKKPSALNLLSTPDYTVCSDCYERDGSNKVLNYFSQLKVKYVVNPLEFLAFFFRYLAKFKEQVRPLSWDNLIENHSGASFMNKMDQCIFDNALGVKNSNFFNFISPDSFGYLTEALQESTKVKSIFEKHSIDFKKGLSAGFYQLSRELDLMLYHEFYVLKFDMQAIGVRITDNFPLFRILKVHRIASTCRLEKFDDNDLINKVKEYKNKDQDYEDFIKENSRVCFNASILNLLQTFEKTYKVFDPSFSFKSCFEKTSDAKKCPIEISKLLKNEEDLALGLEEIYNKLRIIDHNYIDNAEILIIFFGKLYSEDFMTERAMKSSIRFGSIETDSDREFQELKSNLSKSELQGEPSHESVAAIEKVNSIKASNIRSKEELKVTESRIMTIELTNEKRIEDKDSIRVNLQQSESGKFSVRKHSEESRIDKSRSKEEKEQNPQSIKTFNNSSQNELLKSKKIEKSQIRSEEEKIIQPGNERFENSSIKNSFVDSHEQECLNESKLSKNNSQQEIIKELLVLPDRNLPPLELSDKKGVESINSNSSEIKKDLTFVNRESSSGIITRNKKTENIPHEISQNEIPRNNSQLNIEELSEIEKSHSDSERSYDTEVIINELEAVYSESSIKPEENENKKSNQPSRGKIVSNIVENFPSGIRKNIRPSTNTLKLDSQPIQNENYISFANQPNSSDLKTQTKSLPGQIKRKQLPEKEIPSLDKKTSKNFPYINEEDNLIPIEFNGSFKKTITENRDNFNLNDSSTNERNTFPLENVQSFLKSPREFSNDIPIFNQNSVARSFSPEKSGNYSNRSTSEYEVSIGRMSENHDWSSESEGSSDKDILEII